MNLAAIAFHRLPSFKSTLLALAIATAQAEELPEPTSLVDDSLNTVEIVSVEGDGDDIFGIDAVALPGGGFAVVWVEQAAGAVRVQRLDDSGNGVGDVQTLYERETAIPQGYPKDPKIAVDDNGSLVAFWLLDSIGESYPCSEGTDLLLGVTLSAESSVPVGSLIQIQEATEGTLICNLNIAMDNDGDFVVLWYEKDSAKLKFQRYQADAVTTGEFIVVADNLSIREDANLTFLPNNQFIVAWSEGSSFGDVVKAQQYDFSSGNKVGETYVLNENIASNADRISNPVVAPNDELDGGFVSVWQERYFYPDSNDLQSVVHLGRRWAADGSPGEVFVLGQNEYETKSSFNGVTSANISADSEGNFVASWVIQEGDSSEGLVDATGLAVTKDNKLIGEAPFNYSEEFGAVMHTDFDQTRVLAGDDFTAAFWATADNRIMARLFPALRLYKVEDQVAPPTTSASGSGGALFSWVLMLAGVAIGFCRVRNRKAVVTLDETI